MMAKIPKQPAGTKKTSGFVRDHFSWFPSTSFGSIYTKHKLVCLEYMTQIRRPNCFAFMRSAKLNNFIENCVVANIISCQS